MLQADSFLNNLPVNLNSKQRLELEALGFSLASLAYGYRRLQDEATTLAGKDHEGLMGYDPVPLFSSAWAVVDATHLARQIVRALKPKSAQLQAFVAETETATLLRNKLHHIHSNLANLASQGSSPPPLFGALTFIVADQPHHFRIADDGSRQLKGWRGYALHAGKPVATLFQVSSDPASVPAVETPIGMFELHAFGLSANLSELQFSAKRASEFVETDLGPRLRQRVREAAIEHGVDPDEALKNTGVALIFQLEAELVDASGSARSPTPEHLQQAR